jgi:uncharacterized protein YqeY
MSLEENINADLKKAMLAKDDVALRSLRAIKSAILLAKTESGGAAVLTKENEVKLLQKLVKQRRESADIYQQQNRNDLLKSELDEISVIEKYLPAQASEQEIEQVIKQVISETGAKSPADIGRVMGESTKRLSGKAENKRVAELVKKLLSAM